MKLRVTLYMQTQTCIGFVDLLDGERLSDLLNDGSVDRPGSYQRFLQIQEATVIQPRSTKAKFQVAFVNKATIQLVAIQDGDLARGVGAKLGPETHLFVNKRPVQVRLHLPGFVVTGSMYCANQQIVPHLLEDNRMFLPLSNVRIRPPESDAWWTVPFIAVNREQMESIQQEEIVT